jgi:hypothetical protein
MHGGVKSIFVNYDTSDLLRVSSNLLEKDTKKSPLLKRTRRKAIPESLETGVSTNGIN